MTLAATAAQYRRVLVYYDASASAKRAVDAALKMAREHGSEVFVVSVALGWLNREDVEDKALAELSFYRRKRQLDALRSTVADHGIAVHLELLEGNRARQIADAAVRHAADVIVLGGRTRSALFQEVAKLAKQPVLPIQ